MNKGHRLSIVQAAVLPALALAALAAAAQAEDPLAQQAERFALDASRASGAARVQVEVGRLDPRLKLAPCDDVRPYLPPHTRLWGQARIGLRCAAGSVPWNVYLPVRVSVFARSLVAAQPLPAGTVLQPAHLSVAEVDIAAGPGVALADGGAAIGRALARPLRAGDALHAADLKPRQWFDAGDTVRVVAAGAGYAVSGEGVALAPGVEGRAVRVRTATGRVVTGQPVAERRVEVAL